MVKTEPFLSSNQLLEGAAAKYFRPFVRDYQFGVRRLLVVVVPAVLDGGVLTKRPANAFHGAPRAKFREEPAPLVEEGGASASRPTLIFLIQ